MNCRIAELDGFEDTTRRWAATGPPYLASSDMQMAPEEVVMLEDKSQAFTVVRVVTVQEFLRRYPDIELTARDQYFYEVRAMD